MPNWWIATLWERDPVLLISWVVWVVLAIVLHELAHGWTAIRCGDRTPIESGHMTINPLVHMPPIAIMMFVFTGITWGLMPVNPSRFRGRYDDAKVAFAGPTMNLVLAFACLLAVSAWEIAGSGHWGPRFVAKDPLDHNVWLFLRVGLTMNLFLALFNLIPVPPLDGSRIARDFFPAYDRVLSPQQPGALILFMVLFYFGSDYIFKAAFRVADFAMLHTIKLMAPGIVGP
jgi:Zn-dependent protease